MRMQTLLLIEDSPAHRAEIRRVLEAANLFSRIVEASDGIEGLKLLISEPDVDLVLEPLTTVRSWRRKPPQPTPR